ncbi:MAG: 6-phosphogluconolactonase [Chloroflexota bacterium]
MTFTVLPDAEAVSTAGADIFVERARDAITQRGIFRVALSGGSTPKQIYPLLASEPRISDVDWSRVEFWWGDERAVAPDHPDSNFGVANDLLLRHLPKVDEDDVHRMPADAEDLVAAAAEHEADLRGAFDIGPDDPPPALDLIWLGMGPDGHCASLFPGSDALAERERLVVANWAPGPKAWRMTFTYPLINAAREVLFLVTGADKADALAAIRRGADLPAAQVKAPQTDWVIDSAAAGHAR